MKLKNKIQAFIFALALGGSVVPGVVSADSIFSLSYPEQVTVNQEFSVTLAVSGAEESAFDAKIGVEWHPDQYAFRRNLFDLERHLGNQPLSTHIPHLRDLVQFLL